MYIDNGCLMIDQPVGIEDFDEMKTLVQGVKTIVVDTNDVHPGIFQILFCYSKDYEIIINDEFNKRFFESIEFLES